MCYSRRKSTQFCNIYIANIGLFTVQTIIIIIFNIRYSQHSCVRTRAPLQQTITRPEEQPARLYKRHKKNQDTTITSNT